MFEPSFILEKIDNDAANINNLFAYLSSFKTKIYYLAKNKGSEIVFK